MTDVLTITTNASNWGLTTYRVLTIQGKELSTGQLDLRNASSTIPTHSYPPGIYYIQAIERNKVALLPFVKK